MYEVSKFSTSLPWLVIIYLWLEVSYWKILYWSGILLDIDLISLMTNEVEHLFMCLLAICVIFFFLLRNVYSNPLLILGGYLSFYFYFLNYIFIYLAVLGLGCSTRDIVPWPGIKPGPPALGAQSLNHWTTREVPVLLLLSFIFHLFWTQFPHQIYDLQTSSPISCELSFHFVKGVL